MLKILERKLTLQLLVFYSLFVIPLLLGGAELYFFENSALQRSEKQTDQELSQVIAHSVEIYVQGTIEVAMELAHSQAARSFDSTQIAAQFSILKQAHPEISQYLICDMSGKIRLNYPLASASAGERFSAIQYLQAILNSNQPLVSHAYRDQFTNISTISVAERITNAQGHTTGAIILNLSLEELHALLKTIQNQLSENGEVHIWIVDNQMTSIVDTEETQLVNDQPLSAPIMDDLLQNNPPEKSETSADQNDLPYRYTPITGTQWLVAVERPTDITFETVISSFQHSLIIALLMLLAGASIFWFVMHGWVVRPLGRLAQAATQMKPDQTTRVTDESWLTREKSRQDEIGRLVNAFAVMEEESHELFRKNDEKSHTRLRTLDAILRSMDEGVLLENPIGCVVYANKIFARFIGLPARELLKASFQEGFLEERIEAMMESPQMYREALHTAEQNNRPQTIEFRVSSYYNQLGKLVPTRRVMRVRLFQVRDAAGQIIGRGKIFNDVTQQNEAEQVKKNLLGIVSHELRTPLTAIKGYATSLLETDIELDAATQRDFLRRIVEEEDRMAELVTSLLEMSQLEAGTLQLSPSYCCLYTLIERAIEAARIPREHINVVSPGELPRIYIDRRRIEIVLRNLLENAQRYAGEDAEIEIILRYIGTDEGDGLCLSVADNGPGFPKNLTEQIFERFYQIDGSRKRSKNGVGLGLAICRGFVEAHGGRIWAENRTNPVKGAVFHIWLPNRLFQVPEVSGNPYELGKAL